MKLRYKILYMSFGAGLVVLGMVLNSLVSGDAEAQVDMKDGVFRTITCEALFITDWSKKIDIIRPFPNGYKQRGYFGLAKGDAILQIYGDDGETSVASLGWNVADPNREMLFTLESKSKTDKRKVRMMIGEDGGRFDSFNKMGENVTGIGVANDGGGIVDLRDKFGYRK